MPATAQFDSLATALQAASESGTFTTLAAALQAAGLDATAEGDGPFTVFAPTDDAFAALPADTLETLLSPEHRAQLTEILGYHVLPGRTMTEDLQNGTVRTVTGEALEVTVQGTMIEINGARVLQPDIVTNNGVVHVIDRVLLPT